MRNPRQHLTYANVMATVAVFLALGGGAYAAIKLPKNSVGTKQIKNAAVTNGKLANGAVTGSRVANGTLTGTQINAGTLGTVPNASQAANAANAANASAADSIGQIPASNVRTLFNTDCSQGGAFGSPGAIDTIDLIPPNDSRSCKTVDEAMFLGGSNGTLSGSGTQYLAGEGLSTPNSSQTAVADGAFPGNGVYNSLYVTVQTAPGGTTLHPASWSFYLNEDGSTLAGPCTISYMTTSCSNTVASGFIDSYDSFTLEALPSGSPTATQVNFGWTAYPHS